jgi:predicted acylesterase/phospholipase RssA
VSSSGAPRRSLILAGGGMRVAYQAGVIRALYEAGLDFAHADGTSGGIFNLAMLLSGLTPAEMAERWRTLDVKRFASFRPRLGRWPALGDARGLRDYVLPHLGVDVARINAARRPLGTFNVCDFGRKCNQVIPNDRVDLDLLVAGVSLPMFLPPVAKDGALYLDSVWIRDANLMEAVRRGADELWVVWCIGNTAEYRSGLFNQYVHMIELSANGALFEDFERIREINQRIEGGEVVLGHARPITLHVIKPTYPLPLDPDFYRGRIDAATLIDQGYADAVAYLDGMHPDGLPFAPEVTRMLAAGPGVAFRETMVGGFAMGETDPVLGEAAGNERGTTMALHCAIDIRDLDRFVADPRHGGSLVGHVGFAPLGADLPGGRGVFNLFAPASGAARKLMVYELPFAAGGRRYYLAGHKAVADGPVRALWPATTTLYARLHEGPDANGPVVGAGVLHIVPSALLRLGASLRATDASSTLAAGGALLKFGRFFAGELWDSYVRPWTPARLAPPGAVAS